MGSKKFKPITCPICGKERYEVVYRSDFKSKDLVPNTFLSRKSPRKVHYRMVKCLGCGLLYSNPILKEKYINNLYTMADVPDVSDLSNASHAYFYYLSTVLAKLSKKARILDIGCGNGFLLSKLKRHGYKNIFGVEPSRESVKKIENNIKRKDIKVGLYTNSLFKKNFFDLITFFQVFDHLTDPNKFLKDCYINLKPGGYVFALMHNTGSLSLGLLGEESPIIDVQHIHLFNKSNVKKIFEKNGFVVEKVFTTLSWYSLGYWIKMGPFPSIVKNLFSYESLRKVADIKIWFPAGNMAIVARK